MSLDFDDDDSGEVGAANNEVGFTHFALNINTSIVNGVTISLSVIGSGILDDREHFREIYLEAFTYMTLQRHWITPVHAACVVRDGRVDAGRRN